MTAETLMGTWEVTGWINDYLGDGSFSPVEDQQFIYDGENLTYIVTGQTVSVSPYVLEKGYDVVLAGVLTWTSYFNEEGALCQYDPTYGITYVSVPALEEDGPITGEWKIGTLSVAWKNYEYSGQQVSRRYYYYIPSTYQEGEPLPLMISLSGSGTNTLFQMNEGKWNELAEKEGFVLIAPEYVCLHADGTLSCRGLLQDQIGQEDVSNLRWVATDALEPVANYGVDDVAYLTDLMDLFIEEGFVNEHKIFVSGLSHGGYMAERLAIEVPERLAGVGLVAAGIWETFQNSTVTNKVRIVYVQGTHDPIVPYDGILLGDHALSTSLPDSINWFLSRYGIDSEPIVTELPDMDPDDGCTITRSEYQAADGTPQLISFVVKGGGHTWPGGTQYLDEEWVGKLCKDAQASELIWNELKDATNENTLLP